MASKLKKVACDIKIDDPVSSASESELEDDVFELEFTGRLTLHGENDPSYSSTAAGGDDGIVWARNKPRDSDSFQCREEGSKNETAVLGFQTVQDDTENKEVDCMGGIRSCHRKKEYDLGKIAKFQQGRTSFEVASAKTMRDGHKRFVLYTIAVKRSIGNDTSQALIDRRYTEFYLLNKVLKRKYPHIMEHVSFPKKAITGNYRHHFIAERSRAFEQFLTHIYTFEEIRNCPEFQDFFYNRDLKTAFKYISAGDFQEAIPFLQNALHLQEKMLGEKHQDTIRTLCALVVAYSSLEDGDSHASAFAECALQCIGEDGTNPFLISLLQTVIGMRWRRGVEKRHLEDTLAKYIDVEIGPVKMPTLEDLVLQCLSHI
ncbi:sorting nexin-21-like [Anneissia japonica]|uniref:sorting nexin-21-like n=1 Tax=Anneissia japonica TaxID=1529436 RepID=UPI001425B8CF|nr:sorting nexin-21-like [Anneissia japonica]